MNPEIQQLYTELNNLKQKIDQLYRSSTIDRNVETALIERLGLTNISSAVNGSGTTTASTQSVSVASTPTNITVPAQPSGALTVTYKGTTYNLLYK